MANDNLYSQKRIRIFVSDRKLLLVSGRGTDKQYPIAVGKPSTPTPAGTYHIINKIVNPGGGLGTRWMGLDIPDGPYGIHGTFQPDSIGKAISNGCIRLYNEHVEELFSLVRVGTTVNIESYGSAMNVNPAGSHVIQAGDTLWGLAQHFGVSLDELIAFNNITDPNNLQIGTVIRIPLK